MNYEFSTEIVLSLIIYSFTVIKRPIQTHWKIRTIPLAALFCGSLSGK